ncbi:hypothetical protein AVEN_57362-1 [Araneus ventricosus]|uniref:Uncharacterized protein n=1 Tax=Araneus ventricosus TaxID=182803 RepID=A0A4Y2U606_ARAVE|nr:hypothetical protein AVEN_57362-1 [Araneus ventricosus]
MSSRDSGGLLLNSGLLEGSVLSSKPDSTEDVDLLPSSAHSESERRPVVRRGSPYVFTTVQNGEVHPKIDLVFLQYMNTKCI